MTNEKLLSRRAILKRAAAVAVTGSTLAAMSGRMNIMGSALAAQGDYASLPDHKSLVCIFLYGGSDSFSMFLPTNSAQFNRYAAARGTLGVPRAQVLPGAGGAIGFHPSMSRLRARYNRGDLAVVSNVGNLIQPITRNQYLQQTAPFPADLFGHNTQQEQSQKSYSSRPAGVTETGWGGRMADLLMESNSTNLPPTYSISDSNFWLPGTRSTPIALHATNGLSLLPYTDGQFRGINSERERSMRDILNLQRNHLMKTQSAASFRRAWDTSRQVTEVLESAPNFSTPINSGSSLATRLRMVARLIAAREQLGMKRQVFFVGMGGWDTHDNQNLRLPLLLNDLDRSLEDFQSTMEEINAEQTVTSFTCSDFGRTLSINGDGTDHGWGGHYMVLGGAVQGGALYGRPMSYVTGSNEDAGNGGRIIPSTSINQYGAILADWMGIQDDDLNEIFPDLRNHGVNWRAGLQFMG